MSIVPLSVVGALCLGACAPLGQDPAPPALIVELLPDPATGSAVYPRLTGTGERLILSWTEVGSDQTAKLRASRIEAGECLAPVEVATGSDWFVNWADYPSVVAGPGGMFAHWLRQGSGDGHAYDVECSTSADGVSWSDPAFLHDDRSAVEHGFVSTLPEGEGFFSVWLDGRDPDQMKLMARATVGAAPELQGAEWQLDGKTCSCCPTAAVRLPDGSVLVAYRDRSDDEVRDIAVVRGVSGEPDSWSAPRVVHSDEWQILGCPVNGPALAANPQRVALAWFTMGSDGTPRVKVAFSADGDDFPWPARVDDGSPAGRVALAAVPGRDAFVLVWLELEGDRGQWRARLLEAGVEHESVVLADVPAERGDGFLSLAAGREDVFAAWTDTGTGSIRLARIRVR